MSSTPAASSTASAANPAGWRFDHSYSRLPGQLHARVLPTKVAEPRLVIFNRALATSLGLDGEFLGRPENAALFAGNVLPQGAEPLAQAYAGHQYGNFTILGDGRAILLGELITPDGRRFDVQLKGPGPTPYSRRGDGRAALGPMLREYLVSEAMHALGIPTTRSLAVATTGEPVFREEALLGAVLTRVAASHLRVGTMEWAAARGDRDALEALARYSLDRHYPQLAGAAHAPLALFEAILDRQATLVASWQCVGFVHGVMNTDNMALSGETIDYGPCAFMDAYDPATVFSSIDQHGRYAYGNQPRIVQWNLTRLAEAMLSLFDPEESRAVELANGALGAFPGKFQRAWLAGMRAKLGLFTEEPEDAALVEDLLGWMHGARADFTNTFRSLTGRMTSADTGPADPDFRAWRSRWIARLSRQPEKLEEARERIRRTNPAVVPRNHKVEEALSAATRGADLSPFLRLLGVLGRPFEDSEDQAEYVSPPPAGGKGYRTFCGT